MSYNLTRTKKGSFMKRAFLLFLEIGIFCSFSLAQNRANNSLICPTISVLGPSSIPKPNENILYKVSVGKDFDTSKLKYNWTVSSGKIISGQGTSSIIIELGKLDRLVVTVEIQALPQGCSNVASESMFYDPPPQAGRIDEFGRITVGYEKAKLDALAIALQTDPTASAFITKFIVRKVPKAKAYSDLQRVLRYLELRGIEKERLNFGIIYDTEEKTELWIVPAGAEQPKFDDEILDAKKLSQKLKAIKPKTKNKTVRKIT